MLEPPHSHFSQFRVSLDLNMNIVGPQPLQTVGNNLEIPNRKNRRRTHNLPTTPLTVSQSKGEDDITLNIQALSRVMVPNLSVSVGLTGT